MFVKGKKGKTNNSQVGEEAGGGNPYNFGYCLNNLKGTIIYLNLIRVSDQFLLEAEILNVKIVRFYSHADKFRKYSVFMSKLGI